MIYDFSALNRQAHMLAVDRIRELCLRVTEAEGQEFAVALLELANALELYDLAQEEKNGNKAVGFGHS